MPSTTADVTDRVEAAISFAIAQTGKRYVWASSGPNTYDCSGLVYRAFQHAGYKFNGRPTTYSLVGMGIPVRRDQLRRGDLIFPNPGHVQIYLGGGRVVEAASPRLPRNQQIRQAGMSGFWRARRLLQGSIQITQSESGTTQTSPAPSGQNDVLMQSLSGALDWAADSKHWLNLLMIILGILLMIIALYRMAGNGIKDTVLEVVNA
jgi:cell wall-associated NlpC family hydrolase